MHEALANQIVSAFESATYPMDESVAIKTYDDEGANEHFRGTHWRDHDFSELENLTPCLTFFSTRAFCFFLPCFLLAALENPTSWFASDVASRLCPPKNDPSRPSYFAWWSQLRQEQRSVVAAFLKVMQSHYNAIPEANIAFLEAFCVA